MSVIYITHHDENIHNITKTQTMLHKKSPRYKSRYRDKSQQYHFYARNLKSHATMGLPEGELPDPTNFLKKRTGKPSYTTSKVEKQPKPCQNMVQKGKTPTRKELALQDKEIKPDKNFIKENVRVISQMKPKEPEHRIVTDKNGNTTKPELCGLEPVYIKLPIFGRTPNYLIRFNKTKEKEYQMKKDRSGTEQPKCRYITRDEREKLLNGLKQNWEELQKQYQGLPILTDTIPKKIRKSKLEADLKQLEKDIVLVERHPYIYVYNDSEFS
ncbi:enkurin [Cylas formicarius]|uniref:enkurin n=1 Tax=Cylas formicarius TaxID=197179 RepID=UPI002958449D|nr:enkurin [Cylas formicarius]